MFEENTHLNQAVVLLKKAGITFYSIQMAFNIKDKRNLVRAYKRHKHKYLVSCETSKKGSAIKIVKIK